jgi:hypothetical protein
MKRALATALLAVPLAFPADSAAGRFIAGQAVRVGVRSSGMGGNHVALRGEMGQATVNPAAVLLDENSVSFAIEGAVNAGPDFDTRGGLNSVTSGEGSPPLILGFSTTFHDDYAFAIFDALRYNDHLTGALRSIDDPLAQIIRFEEEIRLSTTGLAVSVRVKPRLLVGLALYLDRQKVFKMVDYDRDTSRVDPKDIEAFGTSKAVRGALGLIWSPRGKNTYGLSLLTRSDLTNNLEQHAFLEGITPTPDNPNAFFEQSFPVSEDFFPWSVTIGAQRRQSTKVDLYLDVSYVNWAVDPDRKGIVSASAGTEWRVSASNTIRAGLYTATDPGDYSPTAGLTDEDLRIRDLRAATVSSYPDENTEVFLTGGFGLRTGYFTFDASVEDSHLFSDYGRTLLKFGLTGRLPSR